MVGQGRRSKVKVKQLIWLLVVLQMPYYCSAFGYKNKDGEDARKRHITFHRFVFLSVTSK